MAKSLHLHAPGTPVSWRWGSATAHGVIESVHTESITITSKGTQVTRHGKPHNPAYLIVQPHHAHKVLKLHSEVSETP
ncbi:MAG: DUF2945 domain-containing protein [Alphaproteobacteria bacterium]|nr:MAG: DUF2945 domain-containing protein [Alphaproteobacteria bacterium]